MDAFRGASGARRGPAAGASPRAWRPSAPRLRWRRRARRPVEGHHPYGDRRDARHQPCAGYQRERPCRRAQRSRGVGACGEPDDGPRQRERQRGAQEGVSGERRVVVRRAEEWEQREDDRIADGGMDRARAGAIPPAEERQATRAPRARTCACRPGRWNRTRFALARRWRARPRSRRRPARPDGVLRCGWRRAPPPRATGSGRR